MSIKTGIDTDDEEDMSQYEKAAAAATVATANPKATGGALSGSLLTGKCD